MFNDGESNVEPLKDIKVHLKLLCGTTIEKTFPRNSKVSVLIPLYLESLGIDQHEVRSIYFSYKGKNLNHDHTFDELNIDKTDEEVTFHANHRLIGGF